MNSVTLYTDSDEIIRQCDEEFTVTTMLPNDRKDSWDGYRVQIYDSRSPKTLRTVIQQIYNDRKQTPN